jgi:uncharacterized protein (DUF2235 family)
VPVKWGPSWRAEGRGCRLGKNIVIFSDGTGQRGGLLFDERRTNIYKLYRATRCGPDSCINPAEQLAFYDPGIGTLPAGVGFPEAIGRKLYNLVSQATGSGSLRTLSSAMQQLWECGSPAIAYFFLGLAGVPTQCVALPPCSRCVVFLHA